VRIGLDTSVVLRLLTGEPEDLATVAARRVEASLRRGDSIVISDLVVSEAYFALQHHFGLTKAQALDVLKEFLGQSGIEAAEATLAILALPNLAVARPGLVDRLIHADYLRSADQMLTFEKSGARLPRARVLRA
jgi:predicted nucleic-acid-binding protein